MINAAFVFRLKIQHLLWIAAKIEKYMADNMNRHMHNQVDRDCRKILMSILQEEVEEDITK